MVTPHLKTYDVLYQKQQNNLKPNFENKSQNILNSDYTKTGFDFKKNKHDPWNISSWLCLIAIMCNVDFQKPHDIWNGCFEHMHGGFRKFYKYLCQTLLIALIPIPIPR